MHVNTHLCDNGPDATSEFALETPMAINTSHLGSTDIPANSPEALSAEAGPLADVILPPLVAQSQAAFRRELPELLKKRNGQWVAYHGDECLGFGRSQIELYQQCVRRGHVTIRTPRRFWIFG